MGLVVTLILIVIGYVCGRWAESRHFASIRQREAEFRNLPALTFEPATGWDALDSTLVSGSVVVSLDYFKRFVAQFRQIFGGQIRAYEPLLDRARREALLRMKREARDQGFDAVLNVRMLTSRLAGSTQREGTAGVEILAFGTAIRRTSSHS